VKIKVDLMKIKVVKRIKIGMKKVCEIVKNYCNVRMFIRNEIK
jgi:hypothetical protein